MMCRSTAQPSPFLVWVVHNGGGFDSLLSFLWWELIVMDALLSVGGLLPLMSRSSLHPFLLPPDESELQVYIRPPVSILLSQVSFSYVATLPFFYRRAWHCLCHWIPLSYPRISFFRSMCFLSVWHYCVWLLSWFILQRVCVILWKGLHSPPFSIPTIWGSDGLSIGCKCWSIRQKLHTILPMSFL